jgi:hypothetical protein
MIMIYQKLSHISLVNFHFKLETNQVVEIYGFLVIHSI